MTPNEKPAEAEAVVGDADRVLRFLTSARDRGALRPQANELPRSLGTREGLVAAEPVRGGGVMQHPDPRVLREMAEVSDETVKTHGGRLAMSEITARRGKCGTFACIGGWYTLMSEEGEVDWRQG